MTHNCLHVCDVIRAGRAPVAIHVRHGKAGRDKSLQSNARCLGMHERGRRVGIKDVAAQRLQRSGIDRGCR